MQPVAHGCDMFDMLLTMRPSMNCIPFWFLGIKILWWQDLGTDSSKGPHTKHSISGIISRRRLRY